MSKYLKLLLLATFALSFNILNAQKSESAGTDEKSEEEQEIEKQLTSPSLFTPSAPSAIESNAIIQAQATGIDSATLAAIGSAGLTTLNSQLSGDAATRATQLKTLINLELVL